MVARVKSLVATLPALVGALLLGVAPAAATVAETLPDPTRPPPEIAGPPGGGGGVPGQAAPPASAGLQVVIIGPRRRAAIIDGHTVEVGQKYGGATLVEVREGTAILRDAHGRQRVLSMFPTVGITRQERLPPQQTGIETNSPEQGRNDGEIPQPAPLEKK